MAHAPTLSEHVPLLRRYARALRGSQEQGDQAVRACLAGILDDVVAMREPLPPRVALYQAFHAMLAAETVPEPRDNARKMSLRSRQVLLLTALEGFTAGEVAEILGIEQSQVRQLLQEVVEETTKQRSVRALIIEDEPIISLDLVNIVRTMGHEVVDVGSTHRGAVEAARHFQPGLVLADINLADGSSGMDAVREILQLIRIPVVFVTAFPEKLLTGQDFEPAYLVTKPFVPEAIRAAVSLALLS